MAELFHECGIAAVYHLPHRGMSPLVPKGDPVWTSSLIPSLLLDMQNRGQLAAGMTSYNPEVSHLLRTHKDVGSVTEVFRLNQQRESQRLLEGFAGHAAIGHVRYATCGPDDPNYAQPFERPHIEKPKWFSFGFNGQLANYRKLRDEIESQDDFYLARETDTEILMHLIGQELSGDKRPTPVQLLKRLSDRMDGAYNIALLNARGDMIVARDPVGFRPLCYAIDGPLFAAASESVALVNLGFRETAIKSLPPGHAVIIQNGELSIERYAETPNSARCFFEWIYFANVASTLDDRSVYLARKRLGEMLAKAENVTIDDDTIVVPVPDTAKAAADGMAYSLRVPCLEGLIRNRYVGRTFIESGNRAAKAKMKYTPLREVLEGKRVLLVEDTIVRSTTMKALVSQLRERGRAREIHVRVACPPIIAPCFYGIDMSTVKELFAAKILQGRPLTPEIEQKMAESLGADSLRYLPVEALSTAIGFEGSSLCRACVTGEYPTPAGRELYQLALEQAWSGTGDGASQRTFDQPLATSARA